MIINEKIIMDIFNLKIKLKDKDREKLSKYQELIPMYDIYSKSIYPIKKTDIHYKLVDSHFRFINDEIKSWIENLYEKYKKHKDLSAKYKKNLDIIANYNIKILIETSYKTLYEYSPKLGLMISICKRNSFHPFIHHFNPYYTKLELIKLGQNMGVVKDITPELLINQDIHYKICLKVSSNDVSYEEIKDSTLHIINHDIISYITFYSFTGSFLFNKYLREKKSINNFLFEGIKKISEIIKTAPELDNDYFIYRFIWDDSFIVNLKINEEIHDLGFLSTTRDPFYSPGINGNFGLILIKINIPKRMKGIGLFIENLSLFPKEEEFLLPPFTKLKLLSKDDKFKYFHTNDQFEKLINRKYEFNFIDNDYNFLKNIKVKDNIKILNNFKEYQISGNNRIDLFKHFISESSQIMISNNNKNYLLICMFYDATDQSSYNKLYYNKIKDGLMISIYENGYPYLNIECGNEMIINYVNQYYFYKDSKQELDESLLDIILEIGRIFYYKEAKIFYSYKNFSGFKTIEENKIFKYTNFYNHTLYDYAKNKTKYLNYNFVKNYIGWYNIDLILDSILPDKLINKYNLKTNTVKESLIYIIENYFYLYEKLLDDINKDKSIMMQFNLYKDNYFKYEIYEKLNNQNRIDNFRSNIDYNDEDLLGNDFKLVFRQPIRRF